jgi:putative NADH-flavin reductase
MARIAVIGATGRIGSAIAQEALHRGHDVVALVRDGGAGPDGATAITIDLRDPTSVADAVAGSDAVISAFRPRDGDFGSYRAVAETLIGALRGLGEDAPHLVVVGGASSLNHPDGGILVEALAPDDERRPEMLGQVETLRFLRTVGDVAWAYASPSRKIEPGERTGSYRLGGDDVLVGPDGTSRISYGDYAIALVDEAERRAHAGRRFTVGY